MIVRVECLVSNKLNKTFNHGRTIIDLSYLFNKVQYHNCMKYLLFVQLVGKWHFFQQYKNVVTQGLPSPSIFSSWKNPLRADCTLYFSSSYYYVTNKTSRYFVYFINISKCKPNKLNVFSEKYNNLLSYYWKSLSSMNGTKLSHTKKVVTLTQSLTM